MKPELKAGVFQNCEKIEEFKEMWVPEHCGTMHSDTVHAGFFLSCARACPGAKSDSA